MRCPRCGSPDVRLSRAHGIIDLIFKTSGGSQRLNSALYQPSYQHQLISRELVAAGSRTSVRASEIRQLGACAKMELPMNPNIFYIIGAIVVIVVVLKLLGLY